jgi:hypothetical protein
MKTRILASIIIGGVLATSVAQAETAFSIHDLDVIYSGFNPSFTRDVDVSNYYTTPVSLQNVTAKNELTCHWRANTNTPNSTPDTSHEGNNIESYYHASQYIQLTC